MTLQKRLITGATLIILTSVSAPVYADNGLGTLLGAAGGAIVGSNIGKGKGNIAAIAVGTLLGAGLGSSLDNGTPGVAYAANTSYQPAAYNYGYVNHGHRYHEYHNRHNRHNHHNHRPTYYYPQSNYSSYWVNPAYSTTTTVVQPVVPYAPVAATPQPEAYCREFTQNVNVGGRTQQSYGTACRQADGSWQVQP